MASAASSLPEPIGAPTRRRLSGFARTLRDNGFKVGLAETRDALAIMASPAAVRPSSLKPALRSLFCATHSDWEKFDEIFEGFWRGRGMRSATTLSGTSAQAKTSLRRIAQPEISQGLGLPCQHHRINGHCGRNLGQPVR